MNRLILILFLLFNLSLTAVLANPKITVRTAILYGLSFK